ncbi:MAG: quercetin dioxygenase-like cupin family protein [Neolewinella sp.]|jgi:quercetin dioxygenase-like cupin family protein
MREAWTGRTFAFDFPVERITAFKSRIRGAASRITAAARGLTATALAARQGQNWSIQEHVGHLFELDALHLRRLGELARGEDELTAADMENRATWDAKFNEQPFGETLLAFGNRRTELLQQLSSLDSEALGKVSRHPRLQTLMRPVDIAFFAAEHDDNHISAIETIAAGSRLTPAPATRSAWQDLPYDVPVDLLERHRIIGSDAMVSHITLHKGCSVPVHSHVNEQFSCVLSGKVRYTLANDETCILAAGDVLHLPGFAPHGAEALETTVLLDIFSPPSESTGIDKPQ